MADLARDHRVAALDLSGHGDSTAKARTDWSVIGLAEDVVAALEALEMDNAVLVGHSMGGAVTLEAAARTPSVRGVVLVDSFVLPYGDLSEADAQGIEKPFHEDFAAAMAALVDNTAGPAMGEETRERLKREMAEADTAWALPLWNKLLRWSPESSFGALKVPIHAINGDLIPEPAKQRCAGRVTEWHMPGTGHFPQMEMPEAFNRKLREVLAAL
jgi:pimeloyl-ACP methyl ester carboxylesterase